MRLFINDILVIEENGDISAPTILRLAECESGAISRQNVEAKKANLESRNIQKRRGQMRACLQSL